MAKKTKKSEGTLQEGRILVPVDFSDDSETALLLAWRIAECLGTRLLVLHVVHDPGEMPGYYAKALKKKHLVRIEDNAAEMLQEFLSRVAEAHDECPGLAELDALLVKGLPTSRILEVADKEKASMIVMGSKGRTGMRHLLVGSVAEHVVQLAPIPVTVAKAEHR